MQWKWESRGEAEFQTPNISSIYEGWGHWPGNLKIQDLNVQSEIFVRELTQNFVDAARERLDQGSSSKPKLVFRFLEFSGDDAKALFAKLNLDTIIERYKTFSEVDLRNLKLPESSVYSKDDTLRLLVVTETGTTGMSGEWRRDDQYLDSNGNRKLRKMRDALLSTVGSKPDRGLGSYGEGKRAIIGVSNLRALLTYSAFDEATTSDGVSRRFLGSLYWRAHVAANREFSGLALLGDSSVDGVRPEPFVNDEADYCVEELAIPGFVTRDSSKADNWGTSQIFLDPGVQPHEVMEALVRNWWPLIQDQFADFEVIGYSGESEYPDLSADKWKQLRPFFDCYSVMNGIDLDVDLELEQKVVKVNGNQPAGQLCLAADVRDGGWSYDEPESNRSIIALVREGMLIQYRQVPQGNLPAPFIRGLLNVTRSNAGEIESHLRGVEPPLHNYWNTSNKAMQRESVSIAKQVHRTLNESLVEFRQKYVNETERKATDLTLFDEMISIVGNDKAIAVVQPPVGPKPIFQDDWAILSISAHVFEVGDKRKAEAVRQVKLRPGRASQQLVVETGWEVRGDSKWEPEPRLNSGVAEFSLKTGPTSRQLTATENKISLQMTEADVLIVSWTSKAYGEPWTLRPFVKVSGTKDESNPESGDEK